MKASVYSTMTHLPNDLIQKAAPREDLNSVLMVPPTYFNVVDVKNPHMEKHVGTVNRNRAQLQWEALVEEFRTCDTDVSFVEPIADCEDMVFCANQTFLGEDADGKKICVLSNMKHPSRQREVIAFKNYFENLKFEIKEISSKIGFEGAGDAIWHPGRKVIWGGSGFRTTPAAYEYLSDLFQAPVIHLELKSEWFYHLDTCFCPIDESTALFHPDSFSKTGQDLIRSQFKNIIICNDREAQEGMACNAVALPNRHVILQKGNINTVKALRDLDFAVHEVETSEFIKSGGSAFCMKMFLI